MIQNKRKNVFSHTQSFKNKEHKMITTASNHF